MAPMVRAMADVTINHCALSPEDSQEPCHKLSLKSEGKGPHKGPDTWGNDQMGFFFNW
jgi:hypothetical protein